MFACSGRTLRSGFGRRRPLMDRRDGRISFAETHADFAVEPLLDAHRRTAQTRHDGCSGDPKELAVELTLAWGECAAIRTMLSSRFVGIKAQRSAMALRIRSAQPHVLSGRIARHETGRQLAGASSIM